MIISFAVFWKNDKPGGLGFRWVAQHRRDDSAKLLADYITGPALDNYDAGTTKEGNFTYLWDQLAAWGANKSRMSESQVLVSAMNIAWLEARGHLKSDEYNGIQVIDMPDHLVTDNFLHSLNQWTPRIGTLTEVPPGSNGSPISVIDEAHHGGRVYNFASYRQRRKWR